MTALHTAPLGKPGRILLLAMLVLLPAAEIQGQPQAGSEYQVKAAFIYHFARFTQWPEEAFPEPDSPLVLCLIASDPDADVLLALRDKAVRDRRLVVRKLTSEADIPGCHILYIATEDSDAIRRGLALARDHSILTVGETAGFIRLGGIINFFEREQRLRFAVNLEAAEAADLKFSSQLLMSAEIVQGAP
ncbi:MAG: YfiR family protein [Thermodesulfobacteriota bacterium]